MTRHLKNWCAVFCTAAATVCFVPGNRAAPQSGDSVRPAASARPQEPAASPSSSQTQSPSASDAGKEIDDLIQKADHEMNVDVHFQKCAQFAQQALDLSERAGDKRRAAWALTYLSAAVAGQGRLAEAFAIVQKDVAEARESGDNKILEQALNSAGGIAGESGRYEEALAYFFQCLGLARKIGDRTMEYMSLLNMGEGYSRSGEPERAQAPLQEALRIAGELKHGDLHGGNPAKKATEMALLNLGAMEAAEGRYSEALSYYERVHESHPQSALWQITALEGMASAYEHLGEAQKSIRLLQEAIPAAAHAASQVQSAHLWNELSESQERTGELEAALASENQALAITHASGGNPDYEWQIQSRLGHTLRAMGQEQNALEHYRMAIKEIEYLRSAALDTEEGRAGVLAKTRAVYADTADILVDLHRGADAFQVAEQGRARGFVEMLAQARGGLGDELTPDQAKREDALLIHISSLQKDAWSDKLTAREKLRKEAEMSAAEQELDALHVEISRTNPRYASLRYPVPIGVARAQSELLGGKRILVEFLLGEKRSMVWVITGNKLTVGILPARRQIEEQVSAYRAVLSGKTSALTLQHSLAEVRRRGSALYSTLFGPVARAMPAGSTLIIVPDGILDYLPFETLVTGTRHSVPGGDEPAYLLEKFAVVYGPSATALAEVATLNAQSAGWEMALLAFGDPIVASTYTRPDSPAHPVATRSGESLSQIAFDPPPETIDDSYAERGFSLSRLPFTRREVLSIEGLFPASQRRVYLGPQATEEAMKKEDLSHYRYIHFASHAFVDEKMPELSGILFSSDPASREAGVLDAGEIMRLRLDAEMVTLSACSTGLGKLVNGEGMLGLTRAFLYAGARNVTVSLWNVNDSATAALMRSFYGHLIGGETKEEALRRAKLSLLTGSNPVWRQPYFWGAFVLAGNGD